MGVLLTNIDPNLNYPGLAAGTDGGKEHHFPNSYLPSLDFSFPKPQADTVLVVRIFPLCKQRGTWLIIYRGYMCMRKKSVDVCLLGLMGMAHGFRIKLLLVIIRLCFPSLSFFCGDCQSKAGNIIWTKSREQLCCIKQAIESI